MTYEDKLSELLWRIGVWCEHAERHDKAGDYDKKHKALNEARALTRELSELIKEGMEKCESMAKV
jgi:hypothetical protein